MKIDLTVEDGKGYRIFVNGNLVIEGFGDHVEGAKELESRILDARCSIAAMDHLCTFFVRNWQDKHDHAVKPGDRRTEAADGFIDGLDKVYHTYDSHGPGVPLVPGAAGKGSKTYIEGWHLGRAVRRCIDMVSTSKENREVPS